MNPLKSVHGTLVLGFVTAIIIMLVVGGVGEFNKWSFVVWLHVFAGIIWQALPSCKTYWILPGITITGNLRSLKLCFESTSPILAHRV